MRKFSFVQIFFLLATLRLAAQQELMLQQLPELWHANSTNPAFFPEGKKFAIGLPSFVLDARHSGDITYNDIFRREDGKNLLDLGAAIDKLDPENKVNYHQRLETVTLGFRMGNGWALQAGHSIRLDAHITYPKTLAEVLWNGNAAYLGDTLQIAPAADYAKWQELHLGLSKNFGSVRIGARAKYLGGVGGLQTDEDHRTATVYTDPDFYQLTLRTDYAFNAAYTVGSIDTAGLAFEIKNDADQGGLFSSSNGYAFDLGVQAKLGERLTINLSVLDLGGKITWRDDRAAYFRSNGEFLYDGVTFPGEDLINGVDSLDFQGQLDSLNDIFQFQKTAQEFSTTLPVRYYASASFDLTQRWRLGFTLFHENGPNRVATAVAASAQWTPFNWLSLGAMYGVNDRSAANIGFNVIVQPGPVQIYLMSDNVLTALTPYASPAVNFRMGGSLLF
ncbi:MAG: hypothetical protein JNL02_04335 [Saprospiraceae bacterium]|nr:hypothetical protein [Saprospiraceae bacterium]